LFTNNQNNAEDDLFYRLPLRCFLKILNDRQRQRKPKGQPYNCFPKEHADSLNGSIASQEVYAGKSVEQGEEWDFGEVKRVGTYFAKYQSSSLNNSHIIF